MGRRSQRKGRRGEQGDVRALLDMGVPARRTAPLQAGMGRQSDIPDVQWGLGYELTAECKHAECGYKTVYDALAGGDMLILQMDRRERLYVLSESTARMILPAWIEQCMAVDAT